MKKIIFSILLIALSTFAWSQATTDPRERPEKPSSEEMIKQATKDLSLTDEQVIQWTEIHKKYESALEDRSKARETRQAMGKELEAILTEEQLEKFKQLQPRQSRRRGN